MHRNISVLHSGVVKEIADDDTFSIEAVRIRRCGAGEVHLCKVADAIEEPMAVAGSVRRAAHYKPQNVDAEGYRAGSSGRIKLGEAPSQAGERVGYTVGVGKDADDLVAVVDAEGDGVMAARKINLCEAGA